MLERVFILIPARAGSKRIPNKNLEEIGGFSLSYRAASAGLAIKERLENSGVLSDVVISTDNDVIAKEVADLGVAHHRRRPADAGDYSQTSAVLKAAVEDSGFGSFDAALILQPTSPFRDPDLISDQVISTLGDGISRFSVSSVGGSHPAWALERKGSTYVWLQDPDSIQRSRSQDLSELFFPNGNFFILGGKEIASETLIPPGAMPIILESQVLAIDIDDRHDLELARLVSIGLEA